MTLLWLSKGKENPEDAASGGFVVGTEEFGVMTGCLKKLSEAAPTCKEFDGFRETSITGTGA